MKKNQKHRRHHNEKSLVPIVFGVILVVAGIFMFAALNSPEQTAAESSPRSVTPAEVEFPAPDLTLQNLNGTPESLAQYQGQVVLVNNWATWCPPCKAEMPSLQKYYQAHKEEGFTIVAISAGDTKTEVDQFTQSYGLTFNFWLDPNGAALNAFRNGSLPSSYVIDRDGTIRYAWTGEISFEMLEKYITPLVLSVN